jgi:hypothetical protein
MKSNLLFATAVIIGLGACDVLKQTATQVATETLTQAISGGEGNAKPALTSAEAAGGLKEALVAGIMKGTGRLGEAGAFAQNPSLKIPLPPEVQKIEQKIRDNRMLNSLIGPELDKVVAAMNTGAENSMKLAVPVFKKAVTDMSFTDAMGILTKGDGAATEYLKNSTSSALNAAFKPEVKKALDEVSLSKIWEPAVTKINKNKMLLGLENDIQTDLNQYVTEKATDALFVEIKKEEDKIRKDPALRGTEVLKKAFDYADSILKK